MTKSINESYIQFLQESNNSGGTYSVEQFDYEYDSYRTRIKTYDVSEMLSVLDTYSTIDADEFLWNLRREQEHGQVDYLELINSGKDFRIEGMESEFDCTYNG